MIPLLFLPVTGFAQSYNNTSVVSDTFKVDLKNHYTLSASNIIPGTFNIYLSDSLISEDDYILNPSGGYFTLGPTLNYSIFDTLTAVYSTVKLELNKFVRKRELVVRYDEDSGDTLRVIRNTFASYSSDDIFGSNIQKSGTIVRGFSVGTTKDFTLNSGLRLQLSGKLSDDIEVVAALTDENTPIQPEGNTERLEELDKVFIEIRHPNAIGTFGDYELNENHGEFGKLQRKLQGLKGEFLYDDNRLMAAMATSRGKFNTNKFNGTDAVQGPYRLAGANGESEIIVIAGSERVFLDGQEMKRGENNDYTIEYANAELTFTPSRIITSASRITVEFEYTDRKYSRNFYGGNYSGKFLNDKLKVSLTYSREGDDPDNPVDLILSDEDKEILEQAGDDRLSAVTNGVSQGTVDSLGNIVGIYSRIDTVFNNEPYQIYRYSPGDSTAIYNVEFSYVGAGLGDYTRVSVGNYRFVGIGQGSYLPVRLLPLPELKQNGVLLVEAEPVKDLFLTAEIAGSIYDKNALSEFDDNDNDGLARSFKIELKPKKVELFNLSLGKAGFSVKDRFVQSRYSSLDRYNDVEFSRNYNTDETAAGDEILREAQVTLIPLEKLTINSKYGMLKKGDTFNSDRYVNSIKYDDRDGLQVNYNIDYVASKSSIQKTDWNRQNGSLQYSLGKVIPGVDYFYEEKKVVNRNNYSLYSSSLKYEEYGPFINFTDIYGFNLGVKYSYRTEDSPLENRLVRESKAVTQNYTLSYNGMREIKSSLSLAFRNKNYTDEFKKLGYLDNETVLIRSQSKFDLLKNAVSGDLFYETTTQRAAKLEKVFVRVSQGQGNYIYLGDLNNNGLADENEFQQTNYDGNFIQTTLPTDELFPIVDFKANTRWNINFEKILTGNNWISTILSPVSTETYWRVEEKSREEDTKKIYLMNLRYFLSDSNTVSGSNTFQHDIHLFRSSSEFSARLRFTERRNLSQYSGGNEKGFYKERGIRVKYRFVKEITNQTEYQNTIDNVSAPASSGRARTVTGNEISSDFSYRPINILEVGFVIKTGRQEDIYPATPTVLDKNTLILRVNLSFAGKGRVRMEAERTELTANTEDNAIPFEITGGNYIGKNYYIRLNFDYRLASNLQTSVSYDGRSPAGSKFIHTFKAEARAYF